MKHLEGMIDAFVRRVARLGCEHDCWPGEIGPRREPSFREDDFSRRMRRPGVVAGLGVSAEGGHVRLVEASFLAGTGAVRVAGSLGTTMKESASVALTWVRERGPRSAGLTVTWIVPTSTCTCRRAVGGKTGRPPGWPS